MTIVRYTKLGIVGAGSMGSEMALLFAESGLPVSLFDVNASNVDKAIQYANSNPSTKGKVEGYKDYGAFMASLPSPGHRLLLFSITHGNPADSVLQQLRPHLAKNDVILDGGNEWYENSERRMEELMREQKVYYVGMGVSGGYQSARRGPSLSPGGDPAALERVMPVLERVAAKDVEGNPCVAPIGPGGSGHYVKMIHNGIEQGMMGAMAEAWGLLRFNLGLELDEIGNIFKEWNEKGELKNTFLVDIAADICTKRDPSVGETGVSDNEDHVLSTVVDKVVQDADDSEGTGTWSVMESARLHISAPSMAAAHFLRLASADRAARLKISESLQLPTPSVSPRTTMESSEKARFVEDVRQAVIASFLASWAQGLQVIARQSDKKDWNISLQTCLKIWRAGCIIASDGLSEILQPVVADFDNGTAKKTSGESKSHPKDAASTIPAHSALTERLSSCMPSLRRVMMFGVERDAHVPMLGASLEWVKYVGAKTLPTMFMEAQLDWFGAHAYERWSDEAGRSGGVVKKGSEHYEWKSA